YREETYTRGLNVYTTLRKADQDVAYQSVRRGILDYERRHGYRGPEAFIDLPSDAEEREQAIDDALLEHPNSDDLQSAVVVSVSPKLVRATMLTGETIDLAGDGLRFAQAALSNNAQPKIKLRPGAVIRVIEDTKTQKWSITQLP
ncbi:hypothetical protein NLO81_26850, partial [Escherichia coli]|nr:hypothetical protein [Escherichia coli]